MSVVDLQLNCTFSRNDLHRALLFSAGPLLCLQTR